MANFHLRHLYRVAVRRGSLLQAGNAHRLAKPSAAFERVAIFAVRGGLLRTGEQQPTAAPAAVLGEVLKHALSDLLVVRIVTEACRGECQGLQCLSHRPLSRFIL